MTKYIFVTGGVVSGLGKGIAASSLALLLKARGYKVFMQKFDLYINVDPGTMSPFQHGEVYVTADGTETDLDLGHYERFIDEELNYTSNITTGKVYANVLEKERNGEYDGGTVQIVPHVTNEIKNKVFEAAETSKADFVITEIGGTIGDLESSAFIEALRQIRDELGKKETIFVHVTLVPYMYGSGELKSKPTQHSVIQMRSMGVQPDIIITRSPFSIGKDMKKKIALYCSIPEKNIIEAVDVSNIYQIPLNFYKNKMDEVVLKQFSMPIKKANIRQWSELVKKTEQLEDELTIALIGKYVELHDAYLSVAESLKHAGYKFNKKIDIKWIDSKDIKDSKTARKVLTDCAGIIVPGGFGKDGTKGMIHAITHAREKKIPFMGIGLGMQMAVTEFAQNVCELKNANSAEIDPKAKDLLFIKKEMRLGNSLCHLTKASRAHKLYGKLNVLERHRNNYELNYNYKETLESKGLVISAISDQDSYCEIVELPNHPFFLATIFHPEFKSRPTRAHPLFIGFIESIIDNNK